MPYAQRERIVRIGLQLVLGDLASTVPVSRSTHSGFEYVDVGKVGDHRFGFPIDPVLGDDPRTVMAHDLDWLVDELCESEVAWGKRLPECPLHPDRTPGAHALDMGVTDATVTASCPTDGRVIRTVDYR